MSNPDFPWAVQTHQNVIKGFLGFLWLGHWVEPSSTFASFQTQRMAYVSESSSSPSITVIGFIKHFISLHSIITVKEHKGQSSTVLIQIRLSEKHLNILQTHVFYLPHTDGDTSPPSLLTISMERKDHRTKKRKSYFHLCIPQCHLWTGTVQQQALDSRSCSFQRPSSCSWTPAPSVCSLPSTLCSPSTPALKPHLSAEELPLSSLKSAVPVSPSSHNLFTGGKHFLHGVLASVIWW